MFRFYWPWAVLLLPAPLFFRRRRFREVPKLRFSSLERLKSAFPHSLRSYRESNTAFFVLLSLVWCCLIFALMQPERVDQFKQASSQGYDILLAVDISASMQALDFSTQAKMISRLDVTKEVVSKFVLGRQGDRVGLITFGEHAYMHVPLTLDTAAVSRTLNDTVTGMAGNATALGDAIGLGVRTLRERPEPSRVLILLTDGIDNASSIPPIEAAKLAKKYGIRIYTIGIGKKSSFDVSLDEELLKEIAELTGGHYFLATNRSALESIYSKINELEKSEVNQSLFFLREPLYYYPLGLGMLLLLLLSLYQIGLNRRTKLEY